MTLSQPSVSAGTASKEPIIIIRCFRFFLWRAWLPVENHWSRWAASWTRVKWWLKSQCLQTPLPVVHPHMLENNFLCAVCCLEEAAALKTACEGSCFSALTDIQWSENKSASALFTTNASCGGSFQLGQLYWIIVFYGFLACCAPCNLELLCDSRNSNSARRVCIKHSGQSAVPETKGDLPQRFVV